MAYLFQLCIPSSKCNVYENYFKVNLELLNYLTFHKSQPELGY